MWSNCHHLCLALCDIAVNGGMTHSTSKASCKPNMSPSDLIWPLKAKMIQPARNEQPAVSVHKWSFRFVRLILWYITVVSHKQRKPSPSHGQLSILRKKPYDSWKLCFRRGLLPDRLPLWETLFREYMLESAENCMLSVWQLSCFTFPLFRQNPSEEYLCDERIVQRQRAARCLGSKRVGRGFQGQAAVFSFPVLVLPSRGSEEVSDSETGSNAPSMRLRRLFDGIVLPPPGFKMGGGDSSSNEGPPALLKPRWCPGEQVGSALWPKPSRSHRVSQWTSSTNWAQRSLW